MEPRTCLVLAPAPLEAAAGLTAAARSIFVGGSVPVVLPCRRPVPAALREVGPRVVLELAGRPPVPLDAVLALLHYSTRRRAIAALRAAGVEVDASAGLFALERGGRTLVEVRVDPRLPTVVRVEGGSPALPRGYSLGATAPLTVSVFGPPEELWELSEKLPPLPSPPETGFAPALGWFRVPATTWSTWLPLVMHSRVSVSVGAAGVDAFVRGASRLPVPAVLRVEVSTSRARVTLLPAGAAARPVVLDAMGLLLLEAGRRGVMELLAGEPADVELEARGARVSVKSLEQRGDMLEVVAAAVPGLPPITLLVPRGYSLTVEVVDPGEASRGLADLAAAARRALQRLVASGPLRAPETQTDT